MHGLFPLIDITSMIININNLIRLSYMKNPDSILHKQNTKMNQLEQVKYNPNPQTITTEDKIQTFMDDNQYRLQIKPDNFILTVITFYFKLPISYSLLGYFEQGIIYIFFCYFDFQMTQFSFSNLFILTNKGIPDLSNLPESVTIAMPFYIYSLILQIIIFSIFILYFALSIYRVTRKIKNNKFTDLPKTSKKYQQQNVKNNEEDQLRQTSKKEEIIRDNKVYRFDQAQKEESSKVQQQIKQNEQAKQQIQRNSPIEEQIDNFDDYHDQNQEYFIEIDNKLLLLQPFLIPFIICNNMFAADALTIIMVFLMLISYYLFNIKNIFSHLRVPSLLFIVFSIFGFISFFTNDHDLTT